MKRHQEVNCFISELPSQLRRVNTLTVNGLIFVEPGKRLKESSAFPTLTHKMVGDLYQQWERFEVVIMYVFILYINLSYKNVIMCSLRSPSILKSIELNHSHGHV